MPTDYLELLKQVKQHLETLIEKIDSLDFCPITWDDSYLLLHELETAEAEIDKLSEQLYPILSDDSFCNDTQNKDLVKNIKEADNYVSQNIFESISICFPLQVTPRSASI